MSAPEVSVVIPVLDEAGNVGPLAREVAAALAGRSWELVFVDDGSTDGTAEACAGLPATRVVRHPRNLGQSAATITGIRAARGRVIVTLDGDGQNDPAAIPALLAALDDHDAAVGYRVNRQDPLSRKLASRFAHLVRAAFLRDGIKDVGCALRAFPREVGLSLPVYDGVHRHLPSVLCFLGLRVAQVPTAHRPRVSGRSKYGNLRRGARGLFDLLGLLWLRRRLLRIRGERALPRLELDLRPEDEVVAPGRGPLHLGGEAGADVGGGQAEGRLAPQDPQATGARQLSA